MVFLALTREGLLEALRAVANSDDAVWCNAGALTEMEFAERSRQNLTRFSYEINGNDQAQLSGALATIAEHHPGQRIWVEAVPQ